MGLYSVYPALICHHCKYITTCLLRTHTNTNGKKEKNDINVHFHYVQIIKEAKDKICGKEIVHVHISIQYP